MAWFRKTSSEPLAVTMAGVKLGDRFLSVGVRDIPLIAAVAAKSGLTGRACGVDADEVRVAAAGEAIEREGALVEVTRAPFGMLPYDAGSFDVAVIAHLLPSLAPNVRVGCVSEVLRVLRPGGRVVIIEPAPRGGLVGLIAAGGSRTVGGSRAVPTYEGPVNALKECGFVAVRLLSETDGVLYVEGIRRAESTSENRPSV
jgi:ubiquinone/menaquinone biosynthesis C-methylase UbiE